MSDQPSKTTGPSTQAERSGPRRGRARSGLVVLLAAAVLLTGLGGFASLALRGSVAVPAPVVAQIETRLDRMLNGVAKADLGAIALSLSDAGRPSVELRDVTLRAARSGETVTFPELEVSFARRALMRAEIQPERIRLNGARLRLNRDETGLLSLALSSEGAEAAALSLPELVAQVSELFRSEPLSALREVELSGLTLDITAVGVGAPVTLSDGTARLEIDDGSLDLAATFDLPEAGAAARIALQSRAAAPEIAFELAVTTLPVPLLAEQLPEFPALETFSGPVSAWIDGVLSPEGQLGALSGELALGPGRVQMGTRLGQANLETAHAAWTYEPGQERVYLDDMTLVSDRLRAEGRGYLEARPTPGDAPANAVFQLDLTELWGDLDPFLAAPVSVERLLTSGWWQGGARKVDFGQILVSDQGGAAVITGSGAAHLPADAAATAEFAFASNALPVARVLEFWPATGRPVRVGNWLRKNLLAGQLEEITAHLRLRQGERPKLAASFDFDGAEVQVLPELPAVTAGRGHGVIFNHQLTITASGGRMETEAEGAVDLTGTTFQIPDTRVRGGPADLHLRASGSIPAAFDVLDRHPISLLDKVRLPAEQLSGTARAEGRLRVPLRKGQKVDLNSLSLTARLSDVVFDEVAPDRDFAGAEVVVRIADGAVTLNGAGALEDVPIDIGLVRQLATPGGEGTEITGSAMVSDAGLRALGVRLPPGTLSGQTEAQYQLSLAPDRAPRLTLETRMQGLAVRIPSLGWQKPQATEGALSVALRLGPEPEVEAFRLSAPGFLAEGAISLRSGGAGVDQVTLDRVRIGGWLDARGVLTGRGPDVPPAVALTGGALDLRALPKGTGRPGGAGAARPSEIPIQLDSVIISDKLRLQSVRGAILTEDVIGGRLTARANGGAPVEVTLTRGARNTQLVQVTSADAGGVLRDAGVLRTLQGGALDLRLEARPGTAIYDGTLEIANGRMIETPGAMQFLSAISVVGLFDQMANGGIAFSTISTGLSLSPDGITLREGRANGPAIGITFEGAVMPARNQLDLQGVVSPIYMLNGIGGALMARRGEGLLGVSYRLSGAPTQPEVQVNPLSLLTPGVFRDLFRRAPPDLTQ
ncbi:MAG: AsmA-like C-terminal region-containing protein [Pseudomonadota bacterium]